MEKIFVRQKLKAPYCPTMLLMTSSCLLLLLPPLIASSSVNTCEGEWKYPAKCTGYGCDYKVTWEYLDDEDDIRFTVSTKNRNKWTGIGFSIDKNMPATDAILGLVEESGRFFLMDTWLRNYAAPILDGVQSIHNMSAWRENGITSLRFHRKRRTGDRNDFQFTDTKCPYFVFPVQGGVFNAINKRLRKHEATPIVSESRICVKSCRPQVSSPVPLPPLSTPATTPRRPVQTLPPTPAVRVSTAKPTQSQTSVSITTSTSSTISTAAAGSGPTSSSVPDIFGPNGPNLPGDWDYSKLLNMSDLSKLPQFRGSGSGKPFSVLANFSSILSKMNMSRDDFPTLLKSLAGTFPGKMMNESSPFLFPSPAPPQQTFPSFSSSPTPSSSESPLPSSSSPSVPSEREKEPLPDPLDTDSHSHDSQPLPPPTPTSPSSTTSKPVYRRVSARTRIPTRWSTYKTSTTSSTTSTTSRPDKESGEGTTDDDDDDDDTPDEKGETVEKNDKGVVPQVSSTSAPTEVQESNYVVELKLPKAWKSVYARKKSDEYKKFRDSVESQVKKELQDKFSALEVRVMELKSAADGTGELNGADENKESSSSGSSSENHSVIAKLKVKFAKDVLASSSTKPGGSSSSPSPVSTPQTPVDLTETLNLAIKDGRVGDFSVDSSYLTVRPFGESFAPHDGHYPTSAISTMSLPPLFPLLWHSSALPFLSFSKLLFNFFVWF